MPNTLQESTKKQEFDEMVDYITSFKEKIISDAPVSEDDSSFDQLLTFSVNPKTKMFHLKDLSLEEIDQLMA